MSEDNYICTFVISKFQWFGICVWNSCSSSYVPLTVFGQGASWATIISELDALWALSGGCGHELVPRELLLETLGFLSPCVTKVIK